MAADQNIIVGVKAQDQGFLAYTEQMQREIADAKKEQSRLNLELKNYERIAGRANKVTRNSNGNYKEANRTSRMARGGVSQLGYQIQDVAVQIQGGQNLGLIIGQQGSQIASVFGAGGIVAGAIISIGALIATSMIPKLFEAGQEGKKLEGIFKDLNDTLMTVNNDGVYTLTEGFEKLAKSNRDYSELVLRSKLISAMEAVRVAQDGLTRSVDDFVFVQGTSGHALMQSGKMAQAFATEMGISTEQALALRDASIQVTSGVEGSASALVSMMAEMANTGQVTDKFLEIAAATGSFAMESEKAADFVAAIKEALSDLDGALANNTGEQRKQAEAIAELIEKMRLEVDFYGASARVIAVRDAAMQGANATQIQEIDILQEKLQLLKDQETAQQLLQKISASTGTAEDQYLAKYIEQKEELDRLRDEMIISDQEYTTATGQLAQQRAQSAEKFARQEMQAKMQAVNFIGQAATQMESAFEEGSKAQKAAFLINQGVAVANAIVNTEAAATAALAAYGPAGPAMAGIIKAMGYASVGVIAGQTLASFDGGGFTGMGSRTGGIDGKGGFPAILHPNESVIDHTRGGGAGANVTINISANDTKGFDELLYKRRGMLVNIINQAINNRGRASLA